MKKILLLLAGCAATLSVGAQSFEWVRNENVNYNLNPSYPQFAVTFDKVHNRVLTTRLVDGTQVYGTHILGPHEIESRDSDGNLIWSLSLNAEVQSDRVVTDPLGNVYIAGFFLNNLIIGTVDTLFNTGGALNINCFVIKLDISGNLIWKRNLSPTYPLISYVSALDVDPSGNCWYAVTDFFDGTIARLDANGNDAQSHILYNAKTIGNISFDPWGGLYLSGSATSGPFVMDADTFSVSDTYNFFIARFDPLGNPHWAQFAHDITFQFPVVVADDQGGAFFSATRYDSTSFGNVHIMDPYLFEDFFVIRFDSLGNALWGLQQPPLAIGPFGSFVTGSNLHSDVDAAGNLYMVGVQRGTVDWGNGLTSTTPTISQYLIAVAKINSSGQTQWVKMGGSWDVSYGHAIAVAQPDECYITGFVSDTASFDTIQVQTQNFRNFILAKIGPVGTYVPEITPEAPAFWVDSEGVIHLTDEWKNAEVAIYEISGKKVLQATHLTAASLNPGPLPKGIYLLRFTTRDGKTASGKFVR